MSIVTYNSSSHKNKWVKTSWLLKADRVSRYVPQTKRFTRKSLSSMLSSYNTIFFKPVDGSGGAKIVKITKQAGQFTARHQTTAKKFATEQALFKWMTAFAGTRSFILQKGITLAKSNGKPFDIRVMVQKTKTSDWKATALFCKVGRSNKVTTNYNQGGSVQFIDPTLIGAGFDDASRAAVKAELRQLGLSVASIFSKRSTHFKELGLDVAIDTSGRLWILEVNTRPQFYPLKHMKNKALYRKILSYAKQYGRTK